MEALWDVKSGERDILNLRVQGNHRAQCYEIFGGHDSKAGITSRQA